jgi:hypothetical protein
VRGFLHQLAVRFSPRLITIAVLGGRGRSDRTIADVISMQRVAAGGGGAASRMSGWRAKKVGGVLDAALNRRAGLQTADARVLEHRAIGSQQAIQAER